MFLPEGRREFHRSVRGALFGIRSPRSVFSSGRRAALRHHDGLWGSARGAGVACSSRWGADLVPLEAVVPTASTQCLAACPVKRPLPTITHGNLDSIFRVVPLRVGNDIIGRAEDEDS